MESPPNKYMHLTAEEANQFLTKGWLHIRNAIKQDYIDAWMKDFWIRIGYDPQDKSTWHTEYLHLPRHREVAVDQLAPEAWKKIVEICGGEDRIDPVRERYHGDNFIPNFGTKEKAAKDVGFAIGDLTGWHIDDDWYRMFLDSSGNALTIINVFTDIPAWGGGTCICEDGIAGVVEYLYNHPKGLDPPIDDSLYAHIKDCKQFSTVVAKKGDMIVLHGLLPHVVSPNQLHYARVITNPHVSLREPFNLNQTDGAYSLLEQVILRNLGQRSVQAFKPTRERKYWYPRNAGFKMVYVKDELKRMIAAAKNQGGDESDVNSLWLRQGSEEFREFEKRNGFDLDINEESGLLMEQHEMRLRGEG